MRRVVVTPTFAAGLGVVVAAVLAYPMQTVFSYVAPGASGRGGVLCTEGGCGHPSGPGKPSPLGLGGGALSPSSPGPAGPGNDGSQASAVPQTGGSGGGTAIAEPRLSYKIINKWPGGFWGRITITFPAAQLVAADRLPDRPHPGHEPGQPPRAEWARRGRAVRRLPGRPGAGRPYLRAGRQRPGRADPPGAVLVRRPRLPHPLAVDPGPGRSSGAWPLIRGWPLIRAQR